MHNVAIAEAVTLSSIEQALINISLFFRTYFSFSTLYYSSASNFYSPKWPDQYGVDKSSPCKYKIDLSATKKIIFMDMNIRRYDSYLNCIPYLDDNIQVRGMGNTQFCVPKRIIKLMN